MEKSQISSGGFFFHRLSSSLNYRFNFIYILFTSPLPSQFDGLSLSLCPFLHISRCVVRKFRIV